MIIWCASEPHLPEWKLQNTPRLENTVEVSSSVEYNLFNKKLISVSAKKWKNILSSIKMFFSYRGENVEWVVVGNGEAILSKALPPGHRVPFGIWVLNFTVNGEAVGVWIEKANNFILASKYGDWRNIFGQLWTKAY